MIDGLMVFLAQTITASVPLVLAALAGTISERSGIATISLEGYLLGGAFGAAVCAVTTGSVFMAIIAGALLGALLGALFALGTVTLRANAIVVGVALNLLVGAGTRVALKVLYDSASNSPPLLTHASRSGSLARVALIDSISQPVAWICPLIFIATMILLRRTVAGLRISAAGEHPEACLAQGVSVDRVRWGALTLAGAIGGLGGAHLTLHQNEFITYMTGGRGFLAVAAVILGAWKPAQACIAAIAIGALTASEATLAGRVPFPPAVLQALPFAATLIAVVGLVGRTRAPRALGSV